MGPIVHNLVESEAVEKAQDNEPVFVLLGRDKQAPAIIRLWAAHRAIAEGPSAQTLEAERIADEMEAYSATL